MDEETGSTPLYKSWTVASSGEEQGSNLQDGRHNFYHGWASHLADFDFCPENTHKPF